MFNRMKIVTGLISVIILFGALQFISGGLFFKGLKNDIKAFDLVDKMRQQQTYLDESWVNLLQARNNLNRVGIMYMMKGHGVEGSYKAEEALAEARTNIARAERFFEQYDQTEKVSFYDQEHLQRLKQTHHDYLNALKELDNMLVHEKFKEFFLQKTTDYQNAFNEEFDFYLSQSAKLYDQISQEADKAYSNVIASLIFVMTLLVVVMIISWIGLRKALIDPLNQLLDNIKAFSKGDLTQTITVSGNNEMGMLAVGLMHMQTELINTVRSVHQSTQTIYTGTSEIAAGNNDLSSRTEQQVASLEETAASMEQLTATVKQNADNARQASNLADNASEIARQGGKMVSNVVQTMHEIADSSRKISDITGVIDAIAFQTNILALNAAVEAARAGEHGRGFAVVAGEVRNLAQRSAEAAKEIKALIEDSVNRTDTGSELVGSAGETMNKIVDSVTRVTDIMGEIASASDEQSRGITQVGVAISEMDRVTQQNASLVEQSAAAAAALEEQAKILTKAVALFQLPEQAERMQPENRKHEVLLTRKLSIPPANKTNTPVLKKNSSVEDPSNWETF
ncbi:methyl-accepting chemotaxis protein [Xenorhabdus japonica]|uniref:Methyl-accepting chemotaxis sensory transducer with TarH sensor n=1 Tax=Xenorhabdus japonica TaxID=53341 RepID=A0A1I5AHA4_9GAMM|nr:methyl-accepting chemotaxis protein [Xenorhabdus japonica]SFN61854.1 methyl-accepting chemotaxis sensory transducer with TarH sensor [Xenorhabdus japonica]